jgi:CRP-like cAMP-binding protein
MDALKVKRHLIDDHSLGTAYADGEIIFREGDRCDALYVVQTGKVKVVSIQPSGEEIEIAVAEPGEVFGITSLFDTIPRSASAVAVGEASVLKLGKEWIIKFAHNDTILVFFILQSVCHRARKLKDDIIESAISRQGGNPGSPKEK